MDSLRTNERMAVTVENEGFTNDLYAGFASCPDKVRAFTSYSEENQKQWLIKSEGTINEFLDNLDRFQDFKSAYTFLAKRRHEIAVGLKQRNDEGCTDFYGAFRKEEDHFRKVISAGDGEQYWKWQKNKVFELVNELILPARNSHTANRDTGYVYEDAYIGCLKQQVSIESNAATYYCVNIKDPENNSVHNHDPADADTLSAIELFDYVDNKKLNMIRIKYTPIHYSEKYYKHANQYYQNLLNWKPELGLPNFFENAGKLAYLLAHLLLVKHGNVGIIEWMLRGIAFKHGIQLGQFNHDEGISWDFKAVLTPNRAEYLKWFYEKAFYNYFMLAEQKKIFSFAM